MGLNADAINITDMQTGKSFGIRRQLTTSGIEVTLETMTGNILTIRIVGTPEDAKRQMAKLASNAVLALLDEEE